MATSATLSQKRGSNYTSAEDESIARAYIAVTTDPIVGSDQKGGTFYERIYDAYKDKKPTDCAVRPFNSIETRCKQILTNCTRFSACYASAKALKRSGTNEADNIRLATAFFNKKNVERPSDDVGPKFKFMPSWLVLRILPKFQAGGSTPTRASASDDEAEDATSGPASADLSTGEDDRQSSPSASAVLAKSRKRPERPPGRQRAKELRSLAEHRVKKLRMANDSLELHKRHVAALDRHNDITLFTSGPGGANSEMAQEYFKLQQEERLLALKASLKKRTAGDERTEEEDVTSDVPGAS